mmetsp:Transcript_11733/g.22588  ORF Transcript_11733/g.22588 Transcript_11733/m.22588 type:complete len:115 (-) Transcript_11733:358-702(-)
MPAPAVEYQRRGTNNSTNVKRQGLSVSRMKTKECAATRDGSSMPEDSLNSRQSLKANNPKNTNNDSLSCPKDHEPATITSLTLCFISPSKPLLCERQWLADVIAFGERAVKSCL